MLRVFPNALWQSGNSSIFCIQPLKCIDFLPLLLLLKSPPYNALVPRPGKNLPLEFHRLFINSIQFAEILLSEYHWILLFQDSTGFCLQFSQTEYRVGENVGFGSGIFISSTVQLVCEHPPRILENDQTYVRGFCLTSDQLFCFLEKLSFCFP